MNGTIGPVLVTMPAGQVGRRVADSLAAAGVPTRGIVRNAERVRDSVWARSGGEVVVGDMSNPDDTVRATAGCSALFLALPPDPAAEDLAALWRQCDAAAAAGIEANGLTHVVALSTQGAEQDAGALLGPLFHAENAVRAVAPHVRALRAGCFMENLLPYAWAGSIAEGVLPFPMDSEARAQMVATQDIGDLAASLLADRSWTGHEHFGVYGPEDLTLSSIAATIEDVLGRPVRHVKTTADDVFAEMVGVGYSSSTARLTADMFGILGARSDEDIDPRSPQGTTGTTIRQFVQNVLVPAMGHSDWS